MPDCPSPSAVKKAGSILRKALRGEISAGVPRVAHAIDVLVDYRHMPPAWHRRTFGLRSMVATAGCEVEVTQRLERNRTIIDKLIRESTLPLSSIQDIGEVRAVLHSTDEIRRVESRVRQNRPLIDYKDYITHPRASGYRGVHLAVE